MRRLAVMLAALPLATAAPASAFSGWAAPQRIAPHALYGVSCVPPASCVAVGGGGVVVTRTARSAWHARVVAPGRRLLSVSCASARFCAATDDHSDVWLSSDPAAGAWVARRIDGRRRLTDIRCAASSLCVAVDRRGGVLSSTDPARGRWSRIQLPARTLVAIACPSPRRCLAATGTGVVFVSHTPASGGWQPAQAFTGPYSQLEDLACPSPVACVATGTDVTTLVALRTGDPLGARAWTRQDLDDLPHVGDISSAVGCGGPALCAVVDSSQAPSDAFVSENGGRSWRAVSWPGADQSSTHLTDVACAAATLCVAVDDGGNALLGG